MADHLVGRDSCMRIGQAKETVGTAFPRAHWPKIWSTNPLQRVNKEIKRRACVV